ncbi:hypothetical protein EVA_16316 [gut metagenome]|uniref:Uncharacterized protein n=1 Tax=gut metagenome TaxID=749906 RepID=J9FL15_9ZZZZ
MPSLPPLMVSGSNMSASLVPVQRFSPDTKIRSRLRPILLVKVSGMV